jgi:hypothetical protein
LYEALVGVEEVRDRLRDILPMIVAAAGAESGGLDDDELRDLALSVRTLDNASHEIRVAADPLQQAVVRAVRAADEEDRLQEVRRRALLFRNASRDVRHWLGDVAVDLHRLRVYADSDLDERDRAMQRIGLALIVAGDRLLAVEAAHQADVSRACSRMETLGVTVDMSRDAELTGDGL